jgi:hypothetical protein
MLKLEITTPPHDDELEANGTQTGRERLIGVATYFWLLFPRPGPLSFVDRCTLSPPLPASHGQKQVTRP